ncbi:DUF1349 domain-containing protein [Leptothrix sp. BB-4]
MKTFRVAGIPAEFTWHIEPAAWQLDADGGLVVRSGPKNDYFNDPATGSQVGSAPCALMGTDEPAFILGAHLALDGSATFDAGVIFVRTQPDHWAKFCLERSPDGRPMIVSVVTRGVSDDCNSVALSSPEVFLRVARTPRTFAFHYSTDGQHWQLARYFSLGQAERVQIGWVAQSPMGEGSEVRFSRFFHRIGELANLRDGQ